MTDQPARYGQLWSREESILAFYLYCQIPFQKTKASNPDVRNLAKLLNRSPASVARKLGNFGSFDPELQKRGITGLPNTGAIAEEVWNEFHNDWSRLVTDAETIRSECESRADVVEPDEHLERPRGPSERVATRKERLHQTFFRSAVMTSYLETCCVTGISVSECLIASHIVPWSRDEKSRTDPTNGLCLSATFDRLFDNGFMTIDTGYCVIISRGIRESRSAEVLQYIAAFHGQPIKRPQKFLPSQAHLDWHRRFVFRET